MRILVASLLCLLLVSCISGRRPEAVSSVTIKEIKPRFIEEQAFVRIKEYTTGKENLGDRIIIRTDVEARTGYYFTLVLDESVHRLPSGSVIHGEIHTPQSPDVQVYRFEIPRRTKLPRTKEVFVGLTGADWTLGKDAVPSAWRFKIEDANGNPLGEKQSYLWSL